LLSASNFVESIEERQGLKIACLEEISLRKGYITKQQFIEVSQSLLGTDYGKYLTKILE
jgi:glucose-1-phosphate thymidylyltransferase